MGQTSTRGEKPRSEFEQVPGGGSVPLWLEVWQFVAENKKWWLLPILCVLGAVSVLVFFASTGAAPFVYTLF